MFIYSIYLFYFGGFPGGSGVENLPSKKNTWVQSLDQEDPLEKEIATHLPFLLGKPHAFIYLSNFSLLYIIFYANQEN